MESRDKCLRMAIQNMKYLTKTAKLKHGKETFWYENRVKKKMESHFVNGIEERTLGTQWYKNGQIKLEVIYINGKENGLWQTMAYKMVSLNQMLNSLMV